MRGSRKPRMGPIRRTGTRSSGRRARIAGQYASLASLTSVRFEALESSDPTTTAVEAPSACTAANMRPVCAKTSPSRLTAPEAKTGSARPLPSDRLPANLGVSRRLRTSTRFAAHRPTTLVRLTVPVAGEPRHRAQRDAVDPDVLPRAPRFIDLHGDSIAGRREPWKVVAVERWQNRVNGAARDPRAPFGGDCRPPRRPACHSTTRPPRIRSRLSYRAVENSHRVAHHTQSFEVDGGRHERALEVCRIEDGRWRGIADSRPEESAHSASAGSPFHH